MAHRLGFSTLGCPKWPWAKVLEQASALGYAGIELRGLEGEMDLTKRPGVLGQTPCRDATVDCRSRARHQRSRGVGQDARTRSRQTARRTARRGPPVHQSRAQPRRAMDARVSRTLICPTNRTKPRNSGSARHSPSSGPSRKGSGVGVLMESHGALTDSPSLVAIMNAAGARAERRAGLGHAPHGRRGPRDAGGHWAALGKWVHHTHIKDSVAARRRIVITSFWAGNCRRPGDRAGAGSRRVRRLLRIRMGKGVASGHRRAGSRVPAVHRDDEEVAAGTRATSAV